jgi:hypothetical protein
VLNKRRWASLRSWRLSFVVRLMVFALNTCPRVLPQITRIVTGHTVTDPMFEAEWIHFLRQLGQRLAGTNHEEIESHPQDRSTSTVEETRELNALTDTDNSIFAR